ncbi:MAG: molybdopterin biosynthesis protein [Pirellulales bacterium]|nr:molybdopterin biosynthesis protein [Pirellulales bacterium]
MPQQQFLQVVDRDEAERRFHAALRLAPVGEEVVPLTEALGRVLSRDVAATVDVPSFDRSNFDGYAVRAADTYGASEEESRCVRLLPENLMTGVSPTGEVAAGQAMSIATGGMLPRGADAVIMVEHTHVDGEELEIQKAVAPGFGVAFAGTDITAGETVARQGDVLTSRETGTLAAVGVTEASVWRRPRVAIISTGDEIIAPGEPMRPGMVYDSNARILADAVREIGGEPDVLGIVRDDLELLESMTSNAIETADVVLLSGGTSKGQGDLCYRAIAKFDDPGIVAHGVALKPGKPICLAVTRGKPVVILPGFPTSAVFTFHEFVAPVIRSFAGRRAEERTAVSARLATRVNSEVGRTEYNLVGLIEDDCGTLVAHPMGKGSGSVTTFSRADGFFTIDRHTEIVEADSHVDVQLIGRQLEPADLVVIGSHCVGLDYLIGQLQQQGFRTKLITVGSTAGLEAAKRGECDIAGIHLLDAETNKYNKPFLNDDLVLLSGYGRQQGVVFRKGDARFEGGDARAAIDAVKEDATTRMVNRNAGSGTRVLIDQLLAGSQPDGYAVAARNHNAVAAAVLQGRADWGVCIESVVDKAQLDFLPLVAEQYDFAVPKSRLERPAVVAFRALLSNNATISNTFAEMRSLRNEGRKVKKPRRR